MFSEWIDKTQLGGELIFFPPVPSLPILWLGVQSFNFGKHLQVACVACFVNLLLFDKHFYFAVWLFPVFAIPEFAVVLACFFKTGKIGRELLDRDVNQAEVIKAGRVDQLASIAEEVERGNGGGVPTSFFRLAYLSGCEVDFREEGIEDGALADTRWSNEYSPVSLVKKSVECLYTSTRFCTKGKYLN